MSAAAVIRPDLAGLVDSVATVATAHSADADVAARFPVEALALLRTTRLLGLLVPVEFGGLGGTVADLVTTTERLGRADMSVAMVFAMHCQQVATLVRFAADSLREPLLARIAAGEVYLASVTTEAGKGGDLLSSHAELGTRDGDLLLDRFAPVVTGGMHADGFLVTMRSPDASADTQVSLVYADRAQLDIERVGGWQPMGMRATDSGPLRIRGVVPGDQLVGRRGGFRDIVAATFGPLAHVGWAAGWLGTASGALSRVVRMLRDHKTRGSADLGSELLLTRLATARQRLECVHAVLWHCVDVLESAADIGQPRVQVLINGLKVTASEHCLAAVEDLVDAVGLRHGYLRDSATRLELVLRDLRSASLNYHNDRLRTANGRLALLDLEARLA